MFYIVLGIGLFIFLLGIVNILLIKQKKFSYSTHFWLFSLLYIVAIACVLWFVPELKVYMQHWYGIQIFILASLLFISFGYIWNENVIVTNCYKYQDIPDDVKNILELSAYRNLTKVVEIFFQQLCALLIIIGLNRLGLSLQVIILLFMSVVLILHIPSPKWFGTVYGNYFLWVATALAPLEVYLILYFPSGFYIASVLHIFMYLVMYCLAYLTKK